VKDFVAEATSRLCAESTADDGTTVRDSVAAGINRAWVRSLVCSSAIMSITLTMSTILYEFFCSLYCCVVLCWWVSVKRVWSPFRQEQRQNDVMWMIFPGLHCCIEFRSDLDVGWLIGGALSLWRTGPFIQAGRLFETWPVWSVSLEGQLNECQEMSWNSAFAFARIWKSLKVSWKSWKVLKINL